jgi:hypothetical protein
MDEVVTKWGYRLRCRTVHYCRYFPGTRERVYQLGPCQGPVPGRVLPPPHSDRS